MNNKNILKIILIIILGMIILRCNNEKEYFTEKKKYDYHILKDGEYGCGSIYDLEPIKDVYECIDASRKFSNPFKPPTFVDIDYILNSNYYCSLRNIGSNQYVDFNSKLCNNEYKNSCEDNNNEPFYTHSEDNCEIGKGVGKELDKDQDGNIKDRGYYKYNFCPSGKLWRKKHNMDYVVNEDDAHPVTVGDKKLFTRDNCAYFLKTGKIKNLVPVPRKYDFETEKWEYYYISKDVNHKNNPPNGKEWKAVKWTCTEDCDNIGKEDMYNSNYQALGTCHAYTDIKKIDNNNLKCTEDNKCICKRDLRKRFKKGFTLSVGVCGKKVYSGKKHAR